MTGWPNGYCGDLGLLDSKCVYFTPITLSNETRERALPLSPCSAPPPGNLLGVAPPPFDKAMRIASVRSSLGTIKVEHARTLESRVSQRLSSSGTSSIPVIESERTRSRPPQPRKARAGNCPGKDRCRTTMGRKRDRSRFRLDRALVSLIHL